MKRLWLLLLAGSVYLGALASVGMAQWSTKGPAARGQHTAVLDSNTNRMIIFGGLTFSPDSPPLTHFNDVWYLNNASKPAANLNWVKENPTGPAPSARAGHSAVYAPASNRMIVFGGAEGYAAPCDNDLWILQNANGSGGKPAWVKVTPAGTAPSPRNGHRAIYDAATNSMVVFGGNDCFSTNFNDTWILTNADGTTGTPTWSLLASGGPPARVGHVQTYDPISNRMIIFGGANQSGFLNDVWILANANGTGGPAQWFGLDTVGAPCAREVPAGFYDTKTNVMVIFGGYCTAPMNDIWVLTNANGADLGQSTWIPVSHGTAPLGRYSHTVVYNSPKNRMTIFGGEIQGNGLSTDTVSVLPDANLQ
jgi:hypothetical protein